jgi:Uma2 family endonuclease
MVNTALKLMSVEEFLAWEDGTDTRYELIGGRAIAMAPPTRRHSLLTATLTGTIRQALAGKPHCRTYVETGIRSTVSRRNFFVADIAVSCVDPPDGSQDLEHPVLIVEVLSPSTEAIDRKRKLRDYRLLPTLIEIVLIDAAEVYCEVHRRAGDVWRMDLLQDVEARLRLESIGLDIRLGELYAGIPLEDTGAASTAQS